MMLRLSVGLLALSALLAGCADRAVLTRDSFQRTEFRSSDAVFDVEFTAYAPSGYSTPTLAPEAKVTATARESLDDFEPIEGCRPVPAPFGISGSRWEAGGESDSLSLDEMEEADDNGRLRISRDAWAPSFECVGEMCEGEGRFVLERAPEPDGCVLVDIWVAVQFSWDLLPEADNVSEMTSMSITRIDEGGG